mmetsp:Transcript_79345/g.157186  ORF Transcript_79345/g.157186 Transcript_79345/m.157186 type:complete len:128 (-) Transcript_79345:88-471(-)
MAISWGMTAIAVICGSGPLLALVSALCSWPGLVLPCLAVGLVVVEFTLARRAFPPDKMGKYWCSLAAVLFAILVDTWTWWGTPEWQWIVIPGQCFVAVHLGLLSVMMNNQGFSIEALAEKCGCPLYN